MEYTSSSTASWNLNETIGFHKIKAKDGLYYNVIKTNDLNNDTKVANILANVRKAINTILIYIYDHIKYWSNKKLDFTFCKYNYSLEFCHGIEHTLDLHIPCWRHTLPLNLKLSDKLKEINNVCLKQNTLFEYQEMPQNNLGIIGLNKPKIIDRDCITQNTYGRHGLAIKRKIFLTIRDHSFKIRSDLDIIDLAIHELTHTTSNDTDWIEENKGGNHQSPYVSFHRFMRQMGRNTNILKDSIYYSNKNKINNNSIG